MNAFVDSQHTQARGLGIRYHCLGWSQFAKQRVHQPYHSGIITVYGEWNARACIRFSISACKTAEARVLTALQISFSAFNLSAADAVRPLTILEAGIEIHAKTHFHPYTHL